VHLTLCEIEGSGNSGMWSANSMSDELKVNLLGLELEYTTYFRLQIGIIVGLIVLSVFFLATARPGHDWWRQNAWWLCLVLLVLEVGESIVAISKAKKKHSTGSAG
jgi:hypothetical protein